MRAFLFILTVASLAARVHASSPESLVFDPATGDYLLTYDCGVDGGIVSVTISPENKIAPALESAFEVESGSISYSYSISLGAASRQPLEMFVMDPIENVWGLVEPPSAATIRDPKPEELRRFLETSLASAPSGWEAFHTTSQQGGKRVGWLRREAAPAFLAGERQGGFKFSSQHLPGIVVAEVTGESPIWRFPCEAPASETDVGRALEMLERNNYVPRFVAAPILKVTAPFSALSLLTGLRDHIHQWDQWQLLDAQLSAKVKARLAEAISLLEVDRRRDAMMPLHKLRAILRTSYPTIDSESLTHAVPPSPIPLNPVDEIRQLVTDYDRLLAARVLDFDVAFVIGKLSAL